MNVIDILNKSLRSSADKAAFVSGIGKSRRQLTFSQLDSKVDDLVAEFRSRGLRPGDKVLLAVPVSIESYIAMLAILKAGLVVMYVDPAHGVVEVARCLRGYPPAAIIGNRALFLLRFLSPEIRRIPIDVDRSKLKINHPGYDHKYAKEDINANLPLDRLSDLVSDRTIGSLSPETLVLMGLQPNAAPLIRETIPEIVAAFKADDVEAALLVPS